MCRSCISGGHILHYIVKSKLNVKAILITKPSRKIHLSPLTCKKTLHEQIYKTVEKLVRQIEK